MNEMNEKNEMNQAIDVNHVNVMKEKNEMNENERKYEMVLKILSEQMRLVTSGTHSVRIVLDADAGHAEDESGVVDVRQNEYGRTVMMLMLMLMRMMKLLKMMIAYWMMNAHSMSHSRK